MGWKDHDGRLFLQEHDKNRQSKKYGVNTLNKISEKIDTDVMNEPSFKAIITANDQYAYRTGDGINVIPIGCLKN